MMFHASKASRPARRRRSKPVVMGSAALAASLFLGSCTTAPQPVIRTAKVNPASLAAAPAAWDGREVEIVGLVVWESGMSGLYQSYGAYCRGAERAAIDVRWDMWPGVSPRDSRRRAIVRGVFRNRAGPPQGAEAPAVAAGAPGPGPLEPGMIVRWLSNPERPCRNRQ